MKLDTQRFWMSFTFGLMILIGTIGMERFEFIGKELYAFIFLLIALTGLVFYGAHSEYIGRQSIEREEVQQTRKIQVMNPNEKKVYKNDRS